MTEQQMLKRLGFRSTGQYTVSSWGVKIDIYESIVDGRKVTISAEDDGWVAASGEFSGAGMSISWALEELFSQCQDAGYLRLTPGQSSAIDLLARKYD